MRVIVMAVAMLTCSSPAAAQSATALERITQAAELCHASIRASDADRPKVWEAARIIPFDQSAPDQPRTWSDDSLSVRIAPGMIYGVPGCRVVVSGTFRPTAVMSSVGDWARAAGFAAAQNPKLLFSMQTDDHYLDARRTPDGMVLEFGWRDD